MLMRQSFILLFLTFTILSCVEPVDKSFTKLPPGIWRGVLVLDDNPELIDPNEEFSVKTDFSGELPFNFEVIYTDEDNFYIEIRNAEERIAASEIIYGRDKATAKDTIVVNFPVFDTYLKAIYECLKTESFSWLDFAEFCQLGRHNTIYQILLMHLQV